MGTAQRKLANPAENKEMRSEFVEYEEQRDETPELDDISYESEEDDTDSESEDDNDSDDDSDDEERQLILTDAKMLKQLAIAFLHPENPVESWPTATARCYFNRPSAPEQETIEESEYRQMVEADVIALKKAAKDYLHPELGVTNTNPTAGARCYFDRPSAPTQESPEESEYHQMVLNDVAALKQLAVNYLHPEVGVTNVNGVASARCYFDRPSAPTQESAEESEYHQMVLNDAAALKQLAVNYLHPEVGVTNTNPTITARCYFDRPSAPTQESAEESEYHQMVLNDAAALKQLAVNYLHPELGVTNVNAVASARCYFDRPSALLENTTAFNAPVHNSSKAVVPTSRKWAKTIEPAIESPIAISLSSVQLFGLDNDNADPAF